MTRYTLLTTFPADRGCANVGDQLIEVAAKKLVTREKGDVRFLTIFREDSLDDMLDKINTSAAVLMPGFPVRDVPMYPGCYRLTEDLSRIKPPLIPIGANWNVYPGDAISRSQTRYSKATTAFLHHVAGNVKDFSCREYHTCKMMQKHGVTNTLMTGDPAWYDPQFLGKPMHRPARIEKVVYSPPLSAYYQQQGLDVLELLAEMFPDAKRYCAMHLADAASSTFTDKRPTNDASMRSDVAAKNARIRQRAIELGFEVLELAGDVTRLDFYRECDLHVGYECHAHLGFYRQRRPSVLIAEDARGVGFNYTLGPVGFDGFVRSPQSGVAGAEQEQDENHPGGTSGYCVTPEENEMAPARDDLTGPLRQFLEEELSSQFRRYANIAQFMDETYERAMKPFLATLPD